MRFILLLLILCTSSCSSEEKCNTFNKSKNPTYKENYISNICEISEDSIFAFQGRRGLLFSKDSGKNWISLSDTLSFNEITITDENQLVGLVSWQGRHEPSGAWFYISNDFGQSWKKISLNTRTFFPLSILSKPNEQLTIRTTDNKVYKLIGNNLKKNLSYLRTVAAIEPQFKLEIGNYKIDDYDNRRIKLFQTNQNKIDTLSVLTKCQDAYDLCEIRGTVHISGLGYEINSDNYYAYYGQYSAGKLTEYIIPGKFAYLRKTNSGKVYILTDAGLFIEKQRKIIQLI